MTTERTFIEPVHTKTPAQNLTSRYLMIPTMDLINAVESEGFQVHEQCHFGTRKKTQNTHNRHIIKFRRNEDVDLKISRDEIPEVVIINSHDGLNALRVMSGVFRLICENGLIVGDTYDSSVIRHRAGSLTLDNVVSKVQDQAKGFREVTGIISDMKQIKLSEKQQMDFASEALKIRWTEGKPIVTPKGLLTLRRDEDKGDDLWSIFNVVQENLIKGLVTENPVRNRIQKIREVKSVDANITINRRLWDLTESFKA